MRMIILIYFCFHRFLQCYDFLLEELTESVCQLLIFVCRVLANRSFRVKQIVDN